MNILNLNKIEGYQIQSWPDDLQVPENHAIVPDNLDRGVFFNHNGFVKLTTTEEERVVGTHEEPKEGTKEVPREVEKEVSKEVETEVITTDEEGNEITETITEVVFETVTETVMETVTETVWETVEDKVTVTIVTDWEPDIEAWEAWKASLPPEPAPKPTAEERLSAIEDALCEMDAANAASIAALEDALCEIDAGGM